MEGSHYSEFPKFRTKKIWSLVIVPIEFHGRGLVRRPAARGDLLGAVLIATAAAIAAVAPVVRWRRLHKARDRPPRLQPIRLRGPRFAGFHGEAVVEGQRDGRAGGAGAARANNRRADGIRPVEAEDL